MLKVFNYTICEACNCACYYILRAKLCVCMNICNVSNTLKPAYIAKKCEYECYNI